MPVDEQQQRPGGLLLFWPAVTMFLGAVFFGTVLDFAVLDTAVFAVATQATLAMATDNAPARTIRAGERSIMR